MQDGELAPADSAEGHGATGEPTTQRPDAARRALEEAAARRAVARDNAGAVELGGRGGLEPVRYGDWEVKGLASDF